MGIRLKINKCRIDLYNTENIVCADGFKREVNRFRIDSITKSGKSAICVFYKNDLCISDMAKRITYRNGELAVKINGTAYKIGEYEEV